MRNNSTKNKPILELAGELNFASKLTTNVIVLAGEKKPLPRSSIRNTITKAFGKLGRQNKT